MSFPGASRDFFAAFAAGLRPVPPVPVSQWLIDNIVLVDGNSAGLPWDPLGAPYLVEIADCLGDDHPCNTVTVRKSQQCGASILALGWCLYVADREPANLLYYAPGTEMLRELNGQKFQPLIDAWQKKIKRTVIEPRTSASGSGSSTFEKRFAGGYIGLGNANSLMDLSSKTAKKGVKDELSKWSTLENGSDPETLYFGRFTAFRRTKDYKILEISTPEVDTGHADGDEAGHCRIDKAFKRTDQRYWNVPCPKCEGLFVHDFARLKIDYDHPHRTRYRCPHCPHELSEAERVVAVRAGRWVPSCDEPGRQPGFHIDQFVSLMMSYADIADDAIKAERGGEKDRKDFHNVVLGLPYRFRGDAPDHARLMERREEGLTQGHVPAGGLLLVVSADVQMRGIWVEITALGADRQSWLVDRFYLEGDTGSPNADVYAELMRRTIDASFPDAFGGRRKVDALGIDTGYRSHVVYSVVRASQRIHPETGRDLILAVDGRMGWGLPAIGVPKLVDIDLDGRRIKQGCKLWPIGTWSLKSSFYSDLHKLGLRSGEKADPPGYCHFGMWVDEAYFKQITAERLEDVKVRGQAAGRRWVKSGDNHFLDCRVYNMALAEYLGLSSMAPDDWAALARARGLPDELSRADLFTPKRRSLVPDEAEGRPEPVEAEPPPPPAPDPPASADWIGRDTSDWF